MSSQSRPLGEKSMNLFWQNEWNHASSFPLSSKNGTDLFCHISVFMSQSWLAARRVGWLTLSPLTSILNYWTVRGVGSRYVRWGLTAAVFAHHHGRRQKTLQRRGRGKTTHTWKSALAPSHAGAFAHLDFFTLVVKQKEFPGPVSTVVPPLLMATIFVKMLTKILKAFSEIFTG